MPSTSSCAAFLHQNWLSNRVFRSYDDIVGHCGFDVVRLAGREANAQRIASASTAMCSLVLSPPRERPMA